jgi:hypothetical protein
METNQHFVAERVENYYLAEQGFWISAGVVEPLGLQGHELAHFQLSATFFGVPVITLSLLNSVFNVARLISVCSHICWFKLISDLIKTEMLIFHSMLGLLKHK